ncbi:MAG TPA: hypothetical protein VJK54_08010 [Chthoniobacterales bacterium]|nr:hypothetical protein [Chthoniobacterales bacterium]
MKFIFNLSIILLSTSYIFAQTDTTNQVTACREQAKNRLKATNQVVGCRLQALSREQGTGYRLQIEGTNQSTDYKLKNRLKETDRALSDNAIANCQSPTGNSNSENGAGFFNPVLMGGPVGMTAAAARWLFKTGSNIKATPFVGLGNTLEATRGRGTVLTSVSSVTRNGAMKEWEERRASSGKFILRGARSFTSSSSTKEIGEGERGEVQKNSKLILKEYEASLHYLIGNYLQKKADYEKTIIGSSRRITRVAGYRELITILQSTLDQLEEALQAYKAGKGDENISLVIEGKPFQVVINNLGKSSAEEEKEQIILGPDNRVLVATFQDIVGQNKQVAQRIANKKAREFIYYYAVDDYCLEIKTAYEAKANEAQRIGKIDLADAYREAAEILQRASDHCTLFFPNYRASENADINGWPYNGLYEAARTLQESADYLAQAGEVEEAGRTTIAASYRESAAILVFAAELHKQSALTYVEKKWYEAESLCNEAYALEEKADYQAKASEAEEAGKVTLAIGYKEAVITLQSVADLFKKSVQAAVLGKKDASRSWCEAGIAMRDKVFYQVKACEAVESARIALASAYQEASAMSACRVDLYKQSAEAYAMENKSNEGKQLFDEAWANMIEARDIVFIAEEKEKVLEVLRSGSTFK